MAGLSAFLPRSFRFRMTEWIAIRNPPASGRILLHHRRLYILPTRFGYLYALMLVVLLLAAINYQNSMAYVLTFLLAALGIISLWQTHKNLSGLTIELKTPGPVFQGEDLELNFQLSNPNQAERFAVGLQYAKKSPVYTRIGAEQNGAVSLLLPALKRGLFKPGGFFIFTRYPTGLFHAWGWLRFDVPILIYSRPVYDIELKNSLIDEHSGKNIVDTADGDDFAGLREHHAGESLRHISWKAYAQGRGMLTKTFQGHASPALWIDWSDMSAAPTEGKLSQMTALVLLAHQQGLKYGLRLPGILIEQASGPAQRSDCLQLLATFNQTDMDAILVVDE